MAIKKTAKPAKQAKEKREYITPEFANIEVTRVHQFDNGNISFDAIFDGVCINSMMYIQYVTKDGKEGSMITFPQRAYESKGETKYSNIVWFPISADTKAFLESAIEAKLDEA